jgi:nitroimidazol reductase NimA-like FMN-containing flavoprotein (pyridoxamine 5'-phosphate oxidase superfamily)
MRRKDREIKDVKIMEEILRNCIVCRVAFNGNPYPYIVPMNFGYKDKKLYFHCARAGLKLELIENNPHVAFEVESQKEMIFKNGSTTMAYRSVIGFGKIEVCSTNEEKQNGLKILMVHHGGEPVDHSVEKLNTIEILCLTIDSMTGKENLK